MNSYADDCITVQAATLPFSGQSAYGDDAITPADFKKYAERLGTVYRNLQSANLTVGYLEAQLNDYKDKAQLLPELESAASRLRDLQLEHVELASMLPGLEEKARLAELVAKQNEAIRAKLDQMQEATAPGWTGFLDLIVGRDDGGANRRSQRLSMSDYYQMIQQKIDA